MKYYLVGVDGSKTPDPNYWADRDEVLVAKSTEDAIAYWKNLREGWYCNEPITVLELPEVPGVDDKPPYWKYRIKHGELEVQSRETR